MQSRPKLVGRNSGSYVSITAPLQRVHWVRCSVVQKSWWIHKRSLWPHFFIDCDSDFLLFDGSIVFAVIMRSSFEKIYNHMHIYAKERLSLIKSVHISFCTEAFMGFRTS